MVRKHTGGPSKRSKGPGKERRIEKSLKGRLKWERGEPHPLDVLMKDARELQKQVMLELERVQQSVVQLTQMPDLAEALSASDKAAQRAIWNRYQDLKHREHIQAAFAVLRRKRLLARLQAAQAALDMVSELLTSEDVLGAKLVETLRTTSVPGDEETLATRKLMVGDATAAREQLARFEERTHEIREFLGMGNGWFEQFFVYKTRIKPEVRRLLRQGKEIPPGMEMFETVVFGPYLKYRWTEGNSPIYTISMGRLDYGVPGEEFRPEV